MSHTPQTLFPFLFYFLCFCLDFFIFFFTVFGFLFCFIALIMIIAIIIRTLVFGDPTSGWPSLACIVIFVAGIQLFCFGILGQYLAKAYLETKKRPIYLVEEAVLGKIKDKCNNTKTS